MIMYIAKIYFEECNFEHQGVFTLTLNARLAVNFPRDIAKYGTVVESWYPFGGGGHTQNLFGNDTITEIAASHNKTPAQIILRWHLQAGYVTMPGSQNPDHILEKSAFLTLN